MTEYPVAPAHLQPATKTWWHSCVREFELDSHHVRLFQAVSESWDRLQQAREILDREGLVYLDRFGAPRSRPEVAIERDSRIAFARLLRELAFDVSEPEETRAPDIVGKAALRSV